MTKPAINKLIGFGILVHVAGYIGMVYWERWLQWVAFIGTVMTFTGIVFYFKKTGIREAFRNEDNADEMTYFWNVIVLKLWVAIVAFSMIGHTLFLLSVLINR